MAGAGVSVKNTAPLMMRHYSPATFLSKEHIVSRGFGKVQRGILEALEQSRNGRCCYNDFKDHIWGESFMMEVLDHEASVSRAVTSLVKKGLVKRVKATDEEYQNYISVADGVNGNTYSGWEMTMVELVK